MARPFFPGWPNTGSPHESCPVATPETTEGIITLRNSYEQGVRDCRSDSGSVGESGGTAFAAGWNYTRKLHAEVYSGFTPRNVLRRGDDPCPAGEAGQ